MVDPTVQVAVIGGAFGVVGLLISMRQTRQIKAVGEHASAAREQVQNSHSTNLRDDIDTVLRGITRLETGLQRQGAEIGGVRADLAHERTERLDVARRLDAHLTVSHTA